jgi:hypothetical protein
MRGRDLVVVSALLLVGGVAVVDALRDGDGRDARTVIPSPPPAPTPGRQPQPQRVAPDDYPRGVLDGLLIVADARDCQFRIFSLSGGRERPVQPTLPLAEPCTVWAAARGGPARGGPIVYPTQETGGFELNYPFVAVAVGRPVGPAVLSQDGERVAWCLSSDSGVELHVGPDSTRELADCPDAYTSAGDLAFVRGTRILTKGRTILRASARIVYPSWGLDGSTGLVVEGRLERWEGKRLSDAVEIPDRLAIRSPPVFSPDNCAALFRDVDEGWFEVVALDCFKAERPDLLIFGDSRAVAWSPDGRWIAVAYGDRIGFHRVADGEEVASWPARAAALAWTED